MKSLYKQAYASATSVMLLGLILLDAYIHDIARVAAALLCTSPYWLHYFKQAKDIDTDCVHEYGDMENISDCPSIRLKPASTCKNCGKVKIGREVKI